MRRYLNYIKYVLYHKWCVYLAGRQLSVPLWQLLVHDLSKFSSTEFVPYAVHFYNPDGSKRTKPGEHLKNVGIEFEQAWVRHSHRNLHHWQAWLSVGASLKPKATEMPERYAQEMVADWIGAGKAITGKWHDIETWYPANKEKILLHPNTRAFVEGLLLGYNDCCKIE